MRLSDDGRSACGTCQCLLDTLRLKSSRRLLIVSALQVIGSSLRELGDLVAELKAQGIWTWGAGCLGDDGLLYMRLSAAVYNDLRQYEQLRDAVLTISNAKARTDASQGGERGGTKRPRSTL